MKNGSLKRIVRFVANSFSKMGKAVCKTAEEQPISFVAMVALVGVMTWGMNCWAEMGGDSHERLQEIVVENESFVIMNHPITTSTSTATSTTTRTTSTTTTSITQETNECTTTMCTTTTEVVTTELTIVEAKEEIQVETESVSEPDDESVDYTEYTGVGQYGHAIDPAEYIYLAQVIEHEAADCERGVKERVGICLVNRTYALGFEDSIYSNKEAPGQYFSGWYDYSEESATIAMELISAYNSGAEYWSQFCVDRGLTADTVYQRNDYAVPGTQEVYWETASTSGGYTFTLVYSR